MPFKSGHSSLSGVRALQVHLILNVRNVNISPLVETTLQFLDKFFIHLKSTKGQLPFTLTVVFQTCFHQHQSQHNYGNINLDPIPPTQILLCPRTAGGRGILFQNQLLYSYFKVLKCLIRMKSHSLRLLQRKCMYINYHAIQTTSALQVKSGC